MKIRTGVLTDSNSGITEEEANKLGIQVISMPFTINGEEHYEGITIDRKEFFKKLKEGADVKTSQPSPEKLLTIWDELLEQFEEIVYIPMSSALSSSVMTAKMLAQDYEGKVFVVDNLRISCAQKRSVLEAIELSRQGLSGETICEILEKHSRNTSTYIAVDTLDYLKRGGRITPAGAAIASVMQIKPILQIQGDKLDAYAKARGKKAVHEKLLCAVEQDIHTRFQGKNVYIEGAYSCDERTAEQWKREMEERFPTQKISLDPLSLNISCHIGEGAIAIVCTEELPEAPGLSYQME